MKNDDIEVKFKVGLILRRLFIGKDGTLPVLGNQLLNLNVISFLWGFDPEAVAIQKRQSKAEAVVDRRPTCKIGPGLVSGKSASEMLIHW